jgi:hypothetical protein
VKLTRAIPLLLVIFLLTLTTIVHGDSVVDGYPQLPSEVIVNPSCTVYIGTSSIIIVCPESVVLEPNGLEVTINTTDYNILAMWRSDTTREIIIVFYYETSTQPLERVVRIDLPFPEKYNGTTVYGWKYDVGLYFPPENKTYYYNLSAIAKAGYRFTGTGLSTHPDMRPFYLHLFPVTEAPPIKIPIPSPEEKWNPPEWWDILGWIEYLLKLLGIFVQGLGVGIYTVALMISQLIALTPYLVIIIPLHIVASFVHSPIDGLKAIRFYLELGRKLYDLFIKVVQAIAQFIQAVKPT